MFDTNIDLVDSTSFEFQRYLSQIRILQPLDSTHLAIIDSSHLVYIYKTEGSTNENVLSKGKTYLPKKSHDLAPILDEIPAFTLLSGHDIALLYKGSDVIIARWDNSRSSVDTIPASNNVYKMTSFRENFLIMCSEIALETSMAVLYHHPSGKMKALNINLESRVHEVITDNNQKTVFLLEDGTLIVHNLAENKTCFEIKDKNLNRMALVNEIYLFVSNPSSLYLLDLEQGVFVKEISLANLHKTAIQDLMVLGAKIYLLFQDRLMIFHLQGSKDLNLCSETHVNTVYRISGRKVVFKRIVHVNGTPVISLSLYDLEDQYLNDLVIALEKEGKDMEAIGLEEDGGPGNRVNIDNYKVKYLEKSEKRKIKILRVYDEENGCMLTDTNVLQFFSVKKGKLLGNKGYLSGMEILDIHYMDEQTLLIQYKQGFDLFSIKKMKLKSNCSEYCKTKNIEITGFQTFMSNGKIILETTQQLKNLPKPKKKYPLKDQQQAPAKVDEPSFSDFSNNIFAISAQNTQGFDDGKRTIGGGKTERRVYVESDVPFESDKSPIKYAAPADKPTKDKAGLMNLQIDAIPVSKFSGTAKPIMRHNTTSEESELRALIEQIPDFDHKMGKGSEERTKKKKKEEEVAANSTKGKWLSVISIVPKMSCLNILGINDMEITEAIELGNGRYVALKDEKAPKDLRICNLSTKHVQWTMNFVQEVGEVQGIGERIAVATKNDEGISEMIVIVNWQTRVALMAIECVNLSCILGVVSNHLLWVDLTGDGQDVCGINLKTRSEAEKKAKKSKDLIVCTGNTLLNEKYIEKNKIGFVKRGSRMTGMVYYDEDGEPDELLNVDIKLINVQVLSTLDAVLGSIYLPHVIKDVYDMLYPQPL